MPQDEYQLESFSSFDLIPTGIIVIDENFVVRAWNETMEEWTLVCREEALGTNLIQRYSHLQQPSFLRRLESVFKSGSQTLFSSALHKHFIPIEVSHSASGELMIQKTVVRPFWSTERLAIILIDDVTVSFQQKEALRVERRRLKVSEAQLETYAEELSRSNSDLEQFAYVASHDLQEPLRKVVSFCQLLKVDFGAELNEEANEYIDFAVDGAMRMRQLITDLLAYARIGMSGNDLVPVDLGVCWRDAVSNLHQAIVESEATVESEVLPTVQGDQLQLTQLFQNLIGNAIKYRSDASPVVRTSVKQEDGKCVVRIEDNGIGIGEDYYERVFEIFQRLHGRGEYSGTGVGLGICKKIVERLGGTIWVEAEVGVGSQFFFKLDLSSNATPETNSPANATATELSVPCLN